MRSHPQNFFHTWLAYVTEYPSILNLAAAEGWLTDLVRWHLRPCTADDARALLRAVGLNHLPVLWGHAKGRARFTTRGSYGLSLPTVPNFGYSLRVGLVLHEASHILDHRVTGKFGHGLTFCAHLRRLVTHDWSHLRTLVTLVDGELMACRSYREIYNRHRGPYHLMFTHRVTKVIRGEERPTDSTEHLDRTFSAQDAHETARMLTGDPDGTVLHVHVMSESEGQFIGACYERGKPALPWTEDFDGRMDPDSSDVAPALLPERDQPVPGLDGDVPTVDACAAEAVSAVPAPSTRRPATRGAVLAIDAGCAEPWPQSKGAQIVRAYLAEHQATARDVAAALGDQLKEAGVAFPAALVSRLKQAGFLTEVAS